MENPDVVSFISATSNFGIKGIKSFAKTFTIFFVTNIIAIIVVLFYKMITPALYVFIIAALFTFLALYITYRQVFILGVSHLYQYATPIFKKISDLLVDKFMDVPLSELQTKNKALSKTMDAGKIISETYGKVPGFGKKAIMYMINRIPLVPLMAELKSESNNFENKDEVKELAYLKLDTYIRKDVLATNPATVYVVLLINILIQACVIFYFVQKNTAAIQ